MRALVAGLLLIAASGGAFAQTLACNPQAPRTDPGSGFVPFGAAEQALARGGNSGPAWEWALGTDTDAEQKVQGSLDWVSGRIYAWTVAYSGSGSATLQIRDGAALVLSLAYPSGMDAGNALQLLVSTNAGIGADTTISAAAASINGQPAAGAISQTGNRQDSVQSLHYYYPPMSRGFTAQGTISLSYATLPTGSRVTFRVRAGNLPCTNAAPIVSIGAPAVGSVQQAGSAITVSANAQDADGTIALVEFFANGDPIGTSSTAPYSIGWTAAAGSYILTARATDNAGDRTTSDAVPILVNAPPVVSLTSPAANATFTAPARISIAASAQDADGSISRVELFADSTLIAALGAAPYAVVWTDVPAGTYTLTARAIDNHNAQTISTPVSITVNSGVAQLYFIHADHLSTPREIYNDQQQLIWRWSSQEPFGDSPPDENPSGLGIFEFPLRFGAWQYADKETGNFDNWFRTYSAPMGRYIQSDLIGLKGGLNTYLYAKASPLRYIDPFGLDTAGCDGVPNVIEGPCTLRCCAKHDECFDKWKCSSASWYKKDGCTRGACDACNREARSCIFKCSYSSQHNANLPMYYCAKQHRYVTIPGDFASQSAAEAACEHDHSKDRECCTAD